MVWYLTLWIMVAAVLFANEHLSRKHKLGSELSRKIPHMLLGVTIAGAPFFFSMRHIILLSTLYLATTFVIFKRNLLPHSRAVDRQTWGEVFYGLGIIGAALVTDSKWIFAAAILHLAIADAAAALVGKAFGARAFTIFGHTKSLEGSLAFGVVSLVITGLVVYVAPANIVTSWAVLVWIPLSATATEALTPWGLDNAFLPVVVAVMLSTLQTLG